MCGDSCGIEPATLRVTGVCSTTELTSHIWLRRCESNARGQGYEPRLGTNTLSAINHGASGVELNDRLKLFRLALEPTQLQTQIWSTVQESNLPLPLCRRLPRHSANGTNIWWSQPGSNWRPLACHASALQLSYGPESGGATGSNRCLLVAGQKFSH